MKQLSRIFTALIVTGSVWSVQAEFQSPMPPPMIQGPSLGSYSYHGSIRIEKDRDEVGYQLRIYPGGDLSPESVQVSIQGRSILIENNRSFQREERSEHGYNYARSSNRFRRRLSIPRYADVENMQRRVENGVLIITLPYLNGYGR